VAARLTARWEFQLDMLALQIALFGLVYRYAVREGDNNPMLKMGVLAAFVLPRALFLVELPAECKPIILENGVRTPFPEPTKRVMPPKQQLAWHQQQLLRARQISEEGATAMGKTAQCRGTW